MDYQNHYNVLICRARDRVLEGYVEKHHVVPKCINGPDTEENLVRLTPEEHRLAHLLLLKIYPDHQGIVYAAHMMSALNNKQYGWVKRQHAQMLSETRSGENNPSYGQPGTMLGKNHTREALIKMRNPRINKDNMQKPKGKNSPRYGKKHKIEAIQRMQKPKPEGFGDRMGGSNNPNYGKVASEETRKKMRERAKNRSVVQCSHCDKIGAINQMKRWHFDNCKEK